MKAKILLMIILVGTGNLYGQKIEDLQSTTMPAATIIGAQVNELSKPKSLDALELALINNFTNQNNNFILPNNFGLEVSPYLLSKRRNYNYIEYLSEHNFKNVLRNTTLSLATTKDFKIKDSLSTSALGFGFRSLLISGKTFSDVDSFFIALNKNESSLNYDAIHILVEEYFKESNGNLVKNDFSKFIMENLSDEFDSTQKSVIKKTLDKQIKDKMTLTEVQNAFNASYLAYKDSYLKKFKSEIENVKLKRYGFQAEIAGALSLNFPSNDFNISYIPKYGLWANLSYTPLRKANSDKNRFEDEVHVFNFVGLVRYIVVDPNFINAYNPVDTVNFVPGNFLDFGLRANLELEKFSAGFECIYRQNRQQEFVEVNGLEYSRTINNNSFKFVLNINYQLSEKVVLSYNIGKDFSDNEFSSGALINGFSLNFGFGQL